jgi:FkbM family methyltransferase
MLIEETLRGGYNGLFGEVCIEDCYRLKQLKFVPDLIVDAGCNIGIFSRYARELFPNAIIVGIEAHKENYDLAKYFTKDKSIIFINKAIGQGNVWHGTTAANGSGETYLSEGLGYPQKSMIEQDGKSIERATVETVMLDEIINTYYKDGMKAILKLDIEGAENCLWSHKPSMDAIKKIDYIAAEIHWYGIDGIEYKKVQIATRKALKELEETHITELDNVHFFAHKR